MSIAASGALGGGPVRHAVAGGGVEAEELRADAAVLEAGARAAILATLGVQCQELSGQNPGQGLGLMRAVVHAGGRLSTRKDRKSTLEKRLNYFRMLIILNYGRFTLGCEPEWVQRCIPPPQHHTDQI